MSLESALRSLHHALGRLTEVVSALHVTVAEDKPTRGATVLVDQFDNWVTELLGILEEAEAQMAEVLQRSKPPEQLGAVRHALRDVHASINRFTNQYSAELSAYAAIRQLMEMGNERGREWREWSVEVRTAVERCRLPVVLLAEALLDCWSELSIRMTQGNISMQTTSIGHQVTVREEPMKVVGTVG